MTTAPSPLPSVKAAAVASATTAKIATGVFGGCLQLALATAPPPAAAPVASTPQEAVPPAAIPVDAGPDPAAPNVPSTTSPIPKPFRPAHLAAAAPSGPVVSAEPGPPDLDAVPVAPAATIAPVVPPATNLAVVASPAPASETAAVRREPPHAPVQSDATVTPTAPAKQQRVVTAATIPAPATPREGAKSAPGRVASPTTRLATPGADRIVVAAEPASGPLDDTAPAPIAAGSPPRSPEPAIPTAGTPAQTVDAAPVTPPRAGVVPDKRQAVAAPPVAAAVDAGVTSRDAAPVAVSPDTSAIGSLTIGAPARQVLSAASPLIRAAVAKSDVAPVAAASRPVSLPPANGTTTVHLTPATLGAVTVAITRDADGITVAIAATRPEALVSLAADRHALQTVLTDATGGAAHVRMTMSASPQPDVQPAFGTNASLAPQLASDPQTGFGANGQQRPPGDGAARPPPDRAEFADVVAPVVPPATNARGVVDITA